MRTVIDSSRGRDNLPKTTSVVLLGKGELAIKAATWLLETTEYDAIWGRLETGPEWDVVAVVPVVPEPSWASSLTRWAYDYEVPCVDSGDYRDAPPADLALSIFYDRILPADWIARYGRVLNLHNAPLPAYRGVNPINWALKNGETSHGVTLHEVTPSIDDGPVVAQTTFPVWPETDEVEDVYRRSLAFGWTLLETTLPLLGSIEAVPQDETRASYYSKTRASELGDRAGWRRP
jgi:hypothetical protein